MIIAPRGLPFPDTKTEPVVQLCFLRRQHLDQDALEEIIHLAIVDSVLTPLEGCVAVPANTKAVKEALQSDLQQHHAFNPFSEESKDAIMAAGNTELSEIVDVEPKSQCRACLTYWSAGIVYCTCGHLMKDDTTEN